MSESDSGRPGTASARSVARQVLARVRRDNAYANLALSAALRRARGLPPAERALATELVYGVLRHQRRLDHAISLHLHQPLERVDPETLEALRLAAYQILLLSRVPAYAAVDDAVTAVRRARGARLAGFANAVLRKLASEDLSRELPADEVARLAVERSLPDELARLWIRQLGLEEASRLGERLLERAPLVARTSTLKLSRDELAGRLAAEGAQAEPGRFSPEALRLGAAGADLFLGKAYLDGLWTAQDEAAQLISHLLDPQPGEVVLDGCAGVGGKSTHLCALMGDRGRVLSVDPSARKLELLREHCVRLGLKSCTPLEADLRRADGVSESAVDRVLVDAPCSGLGVVGRHPELKWRVDLRRLGELVSLQRELLEGALRWLRPGGVLVYSVCTTTDEEGPAQLEWLLQTHTELEPDLAPARLAGVADGGVLRLWPQCHGTDGFFAARLRRRA
jgi:16S rRNA (cytosine967-C5)-methyltransferase